jgi:hypothetical protein
MCVRAANLGKESKFLNMKRKSALAVPAEHNGPFATTGSILAPFTRFG